MTTQYYDFTKAIGLAIQVDRDGVRLVAGCQIILKNKLLDFQKKIVDVPLDDLTKYFDPGVPVVLNIVGKGVLHKQVEKLEYIDKKNLSTILPNADPGQFFFQNFISGESSFVSIIRRTEAEKYIDIVRKQGFVVMMLSLGPFPVINVLDQLNNYDDELIFNGHSIRFDHEKKWINYTYNEGAKAHYSLKIDVNTIAEPILIPYAIAFQFLLFNKLQPVVAQISELDNVLKKAVVNKKFIICGAGILVVMFLLLLANFFAFFWLTSANKELANKAHISARNHSDMQNFDEMIKSKESLLREVGWSKTLSKVTMIDQLAGLLPPEVTWQEIAVEPEVNESGQLRSNQIFLAHMIRIKGDSEYIEPINEWIARIKTKSWVKAVELENYNYSQETDTGQFSVLIKY